MKLSTLILLLVTMTAFAANSILCRLALSEGSIGPAAFTAIRLGAGIMFLLPLLLFRKQLFGTILGGKSNRTNIFKIRKSNFWQALSLFGYAIFFSFAYVQLETAMGALILFPTVQISMMGVSLLQGNQVSKLEWIGFGISFSGLIYLLSPGLSAPPLVGTLLMICSGISWTVYSLLGQKEMEPILATARNFLFCLPGVIILIIVLLFKNYSGDVIHISNKGLWLAIFSGAVASGAGYVLWYISLRKITTTAASISQLAVPIIAAIGGILFLQESMSIRLVVASLLILGGISIVIVNRK